MQALCNDKSDNFLGVVVVSEITFLIFPYKNIHACCGHPLEVPLISTLNIILLLRTGEIIPDLILLIHVAPDERFTDKHSSNISKIYVVVLVIINT